MKAVTPTCEVPGCRHDVWSRNYCALHFAEHFPDIEGRVTPQKKELVRMSLTQNLRKVYATKKTHFGFGRKFISSEAQLVIAMLKDVTTAHKGKEVAKVYSDIIIKTFAKAKNLHEQGLLVGQDEKARHEFEFIRTSMCELVLRLLHILKGSVSQMMRRVAEEEYSNTLGELFSLPEFEEQCKRVAHMLVPSLSAKLRPKNVSGVMEILSYFGGAEFWVFFTGKRDWEDRRTILINLLYELLEPLLAYKCLDERCLKASLPPYHSFKGSPFCAGHHLELIGSPLKWYQMPGLDRVDRSRDCTIPPPADGPPPLISFKKYVTTECPNRELYFTMHRILTDYKECKDPKMRMTKAVRIIKTHLQDEAIEPLMFPNTEIQDEILSAILETCKTQQFTSETFFPLWIMIVHEINLVFQQFLQSKLVRDSVHSGLLIPTLILARYGPKVDEGWSFKKLAFSDRPSMEKPPVVADEEEQQPEADEKPPDDPEELAEDTDAERYEYDFVVRKRSRSMVKGARRAEAKRERSVSSRLSTSSNSINEAPSTPTSTSSNSYFFPTARDASPVAPQACLPVYFYRLNPEGTFTWSSDLIYSPLPSSTRSTRDPDLPSLPHQLGEIARVLIPPTNRPIKQPEKKPEIKEDHDNTSTPAITVSSNTTSTSAPTTSSTNANSSAPPPPPVQLDPNRAAPPPPPPNSSASTAPRLEKVSSSNNIQDGTKDSKMHKILGWANQIRRGSGGHTLTANGSPGSNGNTKKIIQQHATLPKNMKLDPVPVTPEKGSPSTSSSFPSSPSPLSTKAASSTLATSSSTTSGSSSSGSSSGNGSKGSPEHNMNNASSNHGSSSINGRHRTASDYSCDPYRNERASGETEEKLGFERRRINSWDISDTRFHKEQPGMGLRSVSAPVLAFDLEKRGEANVLRRPSSSDAFDKRDRAQSILNEEMFLSKLAEDTFRVVPTGEDSDDENALLG